MNWVPRGIKVTVQRPYGWTGLITTFHRRGVMKENVREQLDVGLRRAGVALVANAGRCGVGFAKSTVFTYELNRMFDLKQVRAQMTRTDTSTTFTLTEGSSYVIRYPAVEWIHQLTEIPLN
jgi:hypothetical protein